MESSCVNKLGLDDFYDEDSSMRCENFIIQLVIYSTCQIYFFLLFFLTNDACTTLKHFERGNIYVMDIEINESLLHLGSLKWKLKINFWRCYIVKGKNRRDVYRKMYVMVCKIKRVLIINKIVHGYFAEIVCDKMIIICF